MVGKVILYSLSHCPVCVKARRVLTERGIQFEERVVDGNPEYVKDVWQVSKQGTAPVILWPDGRVQVGIDGQRG